MEQEYISTTEAAAILGVSRIAVFKNIKSGKIPAKKIGRNYVIAKKDISPALNQKINKAEKKFIDDSTSKIVKEYGEALELLGKE